MKSYAKNALFILLLFSSNSLISEKCVRGSKPYGFFADFLWGVNHLEYCIATGKTPVIYWGNSSAYFSPQGYNGSTNVWEYYFEPVSNQSYTPGDHIHYEDYYPRTNNFSTLWWYSQYISNKPKLSPEEQKSFKPIDNHEAIYLSASFDWQRRMGYPTGAYHLYDPAFRKMVKEQIIDRFVRIKPSIKAKIQNFYNAYMAGKKTIGIHLRGRHIGNEVLPVPLAYIFAEANQYADLGYQFFIATDQRPLIEEAKKKLRGNVIYYECERFQDTTSPTPGHPKLAPVLGEDLLIEMCLLTQTDHLIHTLSNVSTAALYFNPDLKHTLIY